MGGLVDQRVDLDEKTETLNNGGGRSNSKDKTRFNRWALYVVRMTEFLDGSSVGSHRGLRVSA